MSPGIYLPDATEGVTRVEDLPRPIVAERSRNYARLQAPRAARGPRGCGRPAARPTTWGTWPAAGHATCT